VTQTDELRLITKVARLYYEHNMRQAEIAEFLGISQPSVSRLLRRAQALRIVRTIVSPPNGVYTELEERLADAYGLKDVVVADAMLDDDEIILRDIGAAAAYYLETTLRPNEVVGISSWSATLLAMVDAMRDIPGLRKVKVVQILGGIGNPAAETHATRLVSRLAQLVHGEAIFLPAPGVVGSAESLKVILSDPFVQATMRLMEEVTLALVGIGEVKPSSLLARSGNIFSERELENLRAMGAVGDILLRFFDCKGNPVDSPIEKRVVGMSLEQLKQVRRAVGIAGGRRKVEAIRGALKGGLINILITDRFTAMRLLE
jgi:DNA-binding transcriptional regulator LsrR (DeoR family)